MVDKERLGELYKTKGYLTTRIELLSADLKRINDEIVDFLNVINKGKESKDTPEPKDK